MQQKRSIIYIITHSATGRVYVGRTRNSLEHRWKQHLKQAKTSNTHLGRALIKHGPTAFTRDVLVTVPHDEAFEHERSWITKLEACDPKKGFNLQPGGSGASFVSAASRDKIGEASRRMWSTIPPERRSALLRERVKNVPKSEAHRQSLSRSKAGTSMQVLKTSRFIGVCKRTRQDKTYWIASCYKHRKCHMRSFATEVEAAQCYDRFALQLHGVSTPLNFPEQRSAYLLEDLSAYLRLKRDKLTSRYRYVSQNATTGMWCVFYRGTYIGSETTERKAAQLASQTTGKSLQDLARE